jgi:ribosomal-protein-alanine N-acetyltransferase
MSRIVFLEGERIYLRALSSQDLSPTYMQWLNDAEVCRHNSHAVFPNDEERMQRFLQNTRSSSNSQVVLAIIDKQTDKHIGNLSLQNINWISRNAEFAILLGDKEFWGKGIGEEAAKLVVAYGFERLNLHRIYCGTLAGNKGMQKLAQKLKMEQEGVRREAIFKEGKYEDIVEFGVLKNDFFKD